MSNCDLILAYTEEYASWLDDNGYPRPPVRPGNRLPTPVEVLAALRAIPASVVEISPPYVHIMPLDPRGYATTVGSPPGRSWDVEDWATAGFFSLRPASTRVELDLVVTLAGTCGQLLVYPDTGEVPVIVDAADEPERVAALYDQAVGRPDSWAVFHQARHGRTDAGAEQLTGP